MEKRPKVLITNDDGPASPLLPPLIAALSSAPWCAEVRVAVPALNQSWKASSVTRYGWLSIAETTISAHPVYLIGGTPADTASIGVFSLWSDPPDLVLSGINIGENMATPYFYCSGTIGAAGMAALSRVPALAFSLAVPGEIFHYWRDSDERQLARYHAHWRNAADVSVRLAERLYSAEFWRHADLCSVNLPFNVSLSSRAAFSQLQRGYFKQLFVRDGRYFRHAMEAPDFPTEFSHAESDRRITDEGTISITPLRISSSIHVPSEFKDAILQE